MTPVYLDGIRLRANHVRLLMNIMGTLNETCENCGGSMIEVKEILFTLVNDQPYSILGVQLAGSSIVSVRNFPWGTSEEL